MEAKRILGIIGGVMLVIGVFLPFLGNMLVQASYVQLVDWDAYIVLASGVCVLILAAAEQVRWVWIPSILALCMLVYTFINIMVTNEVMTEMERGLRQYQWGAGVLLAGAVLSLAASVSERKKKSDE